MPRSSQSTGKNGRCETLVVIPTYNEKENIVLLIERILQLPKDDKLNVLVIDDNSPDGTGKIVQKLSLQNNQIHLLKRPKKEGLGKAYLHGFQYALDNFNWQYLIQMDADFSHNPQDINRFLVELENTDCVIGSRHIPGAKLQYP